MSESDELTPQDHDHLRMLAMGHYVVGALTSLCGFFPIIHLVVGIGLVTGGFGEGRGQPPPPAMGAFFIVAALGMMGMFWGLAALLIVAGRNLRACRRRTFCFVTAVVACVFLQPFGLVLGILTIIVLARPSVRAAFERTAAAPSPIQF